jgi:hypothetical protein
LWFGAVMLRAGNTAIQTREWIGVVVGLPVQFNFQSRASLCRKRGNHLLSQAIICFSVPREGLSRTNLQLPASRGVWETAL